MFCQSAACPRLKLALNGGAYDIPSAIREFLPSTNTSRLDALLDMEAPQNIVARFITELTTVLVAGPAYPEVSLSAYSKSFAKSLHRAGIGRCFDGRLTEVFQT